MKPQERKMMELSLETSTNTLAALRLANEQGAITDTIWLSKYETLFDYIESQIQAMQKILEKPQQRTWVGLTDREKSNLWLESRAAIPRFHTYASLVEAKLKEKNT